MPSGKPLVLVVEDEPFILMAARDGLEANGFDVVEAEDADEGMRQLGQRPDIAAVFTDINMPGARDGIYLANAAREARADIAILVTSGRPMPISSSMPHQSTFIAKPYAIDEVARALADTICGRRLSGS